MLENTIQKKILEASSKWLNIRLFRNNVGAYLIGKRFIKYGLHTGSGDLIGWKKITITPDMIGKNIAVFVSIETKKTKAKPRLDQQVLARRVNDAGGIAIISDSVEKVKELINE